MTSEAFRNNPLFLRNQFEGEGTFQIPIVKKQHISLEQLKFIGYDHIKSDERENKDSVVHFFLDDYKFEVLWNHPEPRLEKLKQYKAVLTPQYSLYTEMPITLQIYNTFRNRWVGAYLQSNGITVIPTMCWGEPQSFWFCFYGVEAGSFVAVSTVGVRKEKTLFMQGYEEMLKRLQPERIICYGEPFQEMEGNIVTVDYEETNHLSKWAACICGEEALPQNHSIVIKRYGYVLAEKGMGRAGGERKNKLHSNRSQLMHILRNDKGHLPDTPANRELIESVANDPQNYVGTDSRGHAWYAQTRSDGTQVWAEVRDHTIINGGVNDKPKDFNETTGLKNNPKKSYLTWGYEE